MRRCPPQPPISKETDYKDVDLSSTHFYFAGHLNGEKLVMPAGHGGYESYATAQEPTNFLECVERQGMRLARGLNLKQSVEVFLVKGSETCFSDCAQAEGLYRVGIYPFGKANNVTQERVRDGVVIRYIEADGKVWSTDFGTGDQTGSFFRIVAHRDNVTDTRSKKITTAEFSCKLYDGSGKELLLTEAQIISRSVQCGHI